MVRIKFEEVALPGEKTLKCAGGCGRSLTRRRCFWQTISPFNRGASGAVKTAEEIRVELQTDIAQWEAQPVTCGHCAHRGGA